ncbi:alpha/beta hydrolase family esterase [Luteimonas sp. WGS1318]|uniref:extracellular catalytic domain type 1 short-chain-length polyhydroxyalkanoate depolymerase n=1 Tax=Luteimonas sp. WGS1318 TaxID=3366815 RepID=UPI00372D67E9
MNPFKKLARRFGAPLPARPDLARLRPSVTAVRATTAQIQTTIERALAAAGLGVGTRPQPVAQPRPRAAPRQSAPAAGTRRTPIATRATAIAPRAATARTALPPEARPASPPDARGPGRGTSTEFAYSHAAGTRAYVLYVPPGLDPAAGDGAPLLLMLHGCTQSPDDFAAGTRMNALADAHGVLVAYPEQTRRDNGSRCWNWFRREDQQRGSGEPAILAGIVGDIATRQRVDPRRVYVAGLSAGAAMAVILGRTYPDVFTAVGAHSGLPFAAAVDVPGAFAAMQGRGKARGADAARVDDVPRVPTIVLHGTADRTVQADNGHAIVDDAIADRPGAPPLRALAPAALHVNGRAATRTGFADPNGHVHVEHVVIDGAGHAWSGGDPAGSHTDGRGPDASALILAFCLTHSR